MRNGSGLWSLPLVAALALLGGCIYAPLDLGLDKIGQLMEVTVVEGSSDDKILLLRVDGAITDHSDSGGFLGPNPATTSIVREVLDLARQDPTVKGLILRINSPGGGVSASDIVYEELRRYREDMKVPIVALFLDTAASGGYYIAQAADRIMAVPTCVTGSIGVIAMFPNVHGLGQKIGVEVNTITSGANKDLGNPFRPMNPKEREILQAMLDSMHQRFMTVVATGRSSEKDKARKGLTPQEVRGIADGRVFTATQALKERLIDEIGYFDDAQRLCERLARTKDARVVTYEPRVFGGSRPTVYSERGAAAAFLPLPQAAGGGDVNLVKLSTGASPHAEGPVFQYLWKPGF